ncbi:MAG: NAD(P)/FAD-dependent oxidoreductase [Candidatus Natronoplasma sp.]
MSEKIYDVVIIGGGPAGLSAAIYTSRAEFNTLVLDEENKLLEKVKRIDNYFGFPEGISGSEILERGRKQAERFGTTILNSIALLIKIDGENYMVETAEETFRTKSLILAPGIQHKKPQLDEIEEYEGKGVSYCVTCDAPLFKGKKVGVLGAEDLALKEALELYEYTQNIKIFTNGRKIEAGEGLKSKIKELQIPVEKSKITGVIDGDTLSGLKLENGKERLDGLMIAEGTSGSLDFAKSLGITVEDNRLVVNKDMFTGIPRVYAAGDCTGGARQIGAAVGEGAKAALNLINELREEGEYYDWKH